MGEGMEAYRAALGLLVLGLLVTSSVPALATEVTVPTQSLQVASPSFGAGFEGGSVELVEPTLAQAPWLGANPIDVEISGTILQFGELLDSADAQAFTIEVGPLTAFASLPFGFRNLDIVAMHESLFLSFEEGTYPAAVVPPDHLAVTLPASLPVPYERIIQTVVATAGISTEEEFEAQLLFPLEQGAIVPNPTLSVRWVSGLGGTMISGTDPVSEEILAFVIDGPRLLELGAVTAVPELPPSAAYGAALFALALVRHRRRERGLRAD